jgi:hypothetical protein
MSDVQFFLAIFTLCLGLAAVAISIALLLHPW